MYKDMKKLIVNNNSYLKNSSVVYTALNPFDPLMAHYIAFLFSLDAIISSLIFHRLSAMASFCANLLGSQKKQLLKYNPVKPFSSSAVAQ